MTTTDNRAPIPVGEGECITCDLPESHWNALDPLYICGGSQCPDCTRHDLNEEATRKHAEVWA